MDLRPERGSIHDPSSQVFTGNGGRRIVRVLDRDAWADFQQLGASSLWREAQAEGDFVHTVPLPQVPDGLGERWVGALEHRAIPVVSYPSEWTFAMLRAAALLHLSLVERAVSEGLATKDASSYNVQFVGGQPVFIDVGSFVRLRHGEPWFGFRQFCEQFLNPLVLHAYDRLNLPDSLKGSVNGISPSATSRLLPPWAKVRPGIFTTIVLHSALERRFAGRDSDVRGALRKAGAGPNLITAQVRRLRSIIESLPERRRSSEWSQYSERSHYPAAALSAKERFVAESVAKVAPEQVLDLGANDGAFSRLALQHGAGYVVATDADAEVIERLFLQIHQAQERRLLPLCVDLTDMNGTHGWAGAQRRSFFDRVRPDLVLCLALIHHLAITASVRLERIMEMLASFRSPVVLEVPLPNDPMVVRLLSRKRDGSPDYTGERIEAEIRRRFAISRRLELPGKTRVLYELQPA